MRRREQEERSRAAGVCAPTLFAGEQHNVYKHTTAERAAPPSDPGDRGGPGPPSSPKQSWVTGLGKTLSLPSADKIIYEAIHSARGSKRNKKYLNQGTQQPLSWWDPLFYRHEIFVSETLYFKRNVLHTRATTANIFLLPSGN